MENHSKRILITGACGLIGRALCEKLAAHNTVTAVDNHSRFGMQDPPHRCEFFAQDLVCFLQEHDNDFDMIYHMAAINGTENFYNRPNTVIEINVMLDLAMFEFAKRRAHCKLIYASTSEVVADHVEVPCAEITDVTVRDIHNPRWSYRLAKILAENYLFNSDLEFLVVRFFNIYGPHSGRGHFLKDLVHKIQTGDFRLPGANETRSFCFVDDAVEALIHISDLASHEVVNIGNDQEISILQAADTVAYIMNAQLPTWQTLPGRPGSAARRCPDLARLRSLFPGYQPRSLREGLTLSLAPHA